MDAQLRIDYESATHAPLTDSLTGLFNHGFFQISYEREILRVERHGDRCTLAFVDLDAFSQYNKQNGAVSGDLLLQQVAGIILENVRQTDLVARYGGDVFALMLIKTDAESALGAVTRIKEEVEKKFHGEATVSIGLASYPRDATTSMTLLENAEEALINAKKSGKNTIFYYERKKVQAVETLPRILVVDDEPRNVKLVEAMLKPLDYEVAKAYNGEEALSLIQKMDVDLILLDVMMPGLDGFEVCRRIKRKDDTRLIPIVLLTALDDMDSKVKGIEAGAEDFLSKPPNKMELLARIRSLIKVKTLNNNLTSIESVLFSLANAIEAKDSYTKGHIQRVANLAAALGNKMNLSEKDTKALRIGGILHDIGKIGVSVDILNKPGALDAEEWEVMRSHPEIGYKICLPLEKSLGAALDVIRYHHEKLDGSGYPIGLSGDQISTPARIMAVVDIFDALTSDRPYRDAMPKEKALGIIRQEAEADKLDKSVVEKLVELVK
jgi:putative two-component system response regulator